MCATRIAYYNMKNYIIVVIGVLGCISCNNSTPSNSYMPSQGYKEESADYADDSESLQQVLCPMCGGTGVFGFISVLYALFNFYILLDFLFIFS